MKIAADTIWRYSVANKGKTQSAMLPPNVEMRSWGTYANLRQLYAESRVVVVPLARPIISGITVALEGMAMGKPVILTRNPYVEGFIEDGVTGFHVEPGNPAALRERIRWLLDHPAGGRGHGPAGPREGRAGLLRGALRRAHPRPVLLGPRRSQRPGNPEQGTSGKTCWGP